MQKTPVISIVDDDESVRQAVRSLVCSLELDAQTFASAEEYLSSPYASETDCLISDVQMPEMSGIELQEHLAARGWRTPIIFVTAFPDRRIEARAMKAGAIGFLNKPFDGQALIRCIDAALASRRGEAVRA